MNEGWVLLSRKLRKWRWVHRPEYVSFLVHCIMEANTQDYYFEHDNVPRGSFVTSISGFSKQIGITPQTCRTIIKNLCECGTITVKSTNKYTVITLCKFGSYQDYNSDTNKQLTNNQQTTNKQLTNNQQTTNNNITNNNKQLTINNKLLGENSANFPTGEKTARNSNLFEDLEPSDLKTESEKEKRKIAPKEKRTIFTPPTVEEVAAYIAEKGYHVNAETFWNWYQSKNWYVGKNKMKDWKAAVRTWEQKWKEEQKNGNNYTNRHASVEPRSDVRPEDF